MLKLPFSRECIGGIIATINKKMKAEYTDGYRDVPIYTTIINAQQNESTTGKSTLPKNLLILRKPHSL